MTRLRELPWISVTLSLGYMLASYLRWPVTTGSPCATSAAAFPRQRAFELLHRNRGRLNLGMAMLSGGAVRYRLYSAAGLSATEIATVIGLIGVTFAIGVSFVLGLTLLLEPTPVVSSCRCRPQGCNCSAPCSRPGVELCSGRRHPSAADPHPQLANQLPAPGTALLQLLCRGGHRLRGGGAACAAAGGSGGFVSTPAVRHTLAISAA